MARLEKGQVFAGRYHLIEQLGMGGFSEVWKATDQMAGDMVMAIKIFAPEKGLDAEGVKTFSKEYSLVFNLSHNNLLTPSHYDIWQGSPYLVMKYIPNGSAYRRVGKMPEEEVIEFLTQACLALSYLHLEEPPIIHQDIKPDNFLIDADGKYVLTDFGISSKIKRTLTRSIGIQEGSTSGTQAYMPPEKFTKNISDRKPQAAGDIWALGATAFELLTGEIPFGSLGGLGQMTGAETPDLPAHFSKSLNSLLSELLSKESYLRPTARQTLIRLDEIKNGIEQEELEADIPDESHERSDFGRKTTRIETPVQEQQEAALPDIEKKDSVIEKKRRNNKERERLAKIAKGTYNAYSWFYFTGFIFLLTGYFMIAYYDPSPYTKSYPLNDMGLVIGSVGLALALIAMILNMSVIYQGWRSIQDGEAYTSPEKAVGYLFIPFYNYYWVFIALRRMFIDMNRYDKKTYANYEYATFVSVVSVIPLINLLNIIFVPILMAKIKNNTLFVLTGKHRIARNSTHTSLNVMGALIFVFTAVLISVSVNERIKTQKKYQGYISSANDALETNDFEQARSYLKRAQYLDPQFDYIDDRPADMLLDLDNLEKEFNFENHKSTANGLILRGLYNQAVEEFEKASSIKDDEYITTALVVVKDFIAASKKRTNINRKTESYDEDSYTGSHDYLGARAGWGVYSWSSGHKHIGQWVSNNREGSGVMRWNNGDIDLGYWKDDSKKGQFLRYSNASKTWVLKTE